MKFTSSGFISGKSESSIQTVLGEYGLEIKNSTEIPHKPLFLNKEEK